VGNASEYPYGRIVSQLAAWKAFRQPAESDLLATFPEDVGSYKRGDPIPMRFMNRWVDEKLAKEGIDSGTVIKTGSGYNARAGGAIASELAEPRTELIRQMGGWQSVSCHKHYTGAQVKRICAVSSHIYGHSLHFGVLPPPGKMWGPLGQDQ